jgi:type IV pilus assembly protein PilA
MITVTIISILAALALPAYQGYTMRAKVSEAFKLVAPVQLKLAELYQQAGEFPGSNESASLPPPADFAGRFLSSIEVQTGGVIVATYSAPGLAGHAVTFTPNVVGRTLRWDCTSDLPPSYLPATCR